VLYFSDVFVVGDVGCEVLTPSIRQRVACVFPDGVDCEVAWYVGVCDVFEHASDAFNFVGGFADAKVFTFWRYRHRHFRLLY